MVSRYEGIQRLPVLRLVDERAESSPLVLQQILRSAELDLRARCCSTKGIKVRKSRAYDMTSVKDHLG
jgi:hypothetical protein